MQQNPSSSPIPTPSYLPQIPELPSTGLQIPIDDPTASSLFDWSDFLDFNLDETLTISFPEPEPETDNQTPVPADPTSQPASDNLGRVRKRDPRLVCSNFLAGRVPCACPELDRELEEEESAGLPGKKRPRTARGSGGGGGPLRCQVPGCEADISELKGYHRRHRVCLRCANAGEVVLDGESKRYCQQCGKFHILSDFDEGKRSCRRKLERHNNRRRKKPNDFKGLEKEAQHIVLADDVSGDDSADKEGICANSQSEEKERFLEPDGQMSTLCSGPGSQKSDSVVSFAASDETHTDRENQNPKRKRSQKSDSVVSFAASDETHTERENQNPKYKRSPSYCENKSAFSSLCPGGRISFKLYDWNPAEFPRRLRHQIFQWLASMPVELEGYIRPGCTILTAFIAMPKPMWLKLMEAPARHIKDLVATPGSMLSGRGTMLVYLNDMMFQVTKDATSIVRVKVKDRAPKLHYIYPMCFEAGRPMEFVACGTDLLQPNFRFLVSFAGRYLTYNISVSSGSCEKGDAKSIDHQLLKIYVPQTDMDLFGPGFIEVENQSGLSNFIPILVGDKETCAEMGILQQKFDIPLSSQEQKPSPQRYSCEVLALRQAQLSEFLLDVACLLKNPISGQQLTSCHIQRFNCLLSCLIENESSVILRRVFCSLQSLMADNLVCGVSDSDMRLLRKIMSIAQSKLAQTSLEKALSVVPDGNFHSCNSGDDDQSVGPAPNQGCPRILKSMLGVNCYSQSTDEGATVPLLKGEVIMDVNLQEQPGKCARRLLTQKFSTSRALIIAIAAIGVCFGLCAVVLHPQGVGQITTTIRRCLFVNS